MSTEFGVGDLHWKLLYKFSFFLVSVESNIYLYEAKINFFKNVHKNIAYKNV
jgi:hypothetical protein